MLGFSSYYEGKNNRIKRKEKMFLDFFATKGTKPKFFINGPDKISQSCSYVSVASAKNNRREKTKQTEPPPCVIYPKRGKGNARSKPGKDMVSRPKRMGSVVGYAKGRY